MLNMLLEDQAGDVLKKFRYGRKKSLKEVSGASGLPADLLRSLEAGEIAPDLPQLESLGQALGFDGAAMAALHLHPETTPEVLPPPHFLPVRENFGGYAVWCTLLLHPEDPRRALLVDTGGGGELLLDTIRRRNLRIEGILLTHGHGDHGGGFVGAVPGKDVPVLLSRLDLPLLPETGLYPGPLLSPFEGCRELLKRGWKVEVTEAPGHTPGSVAYSTGGGLLVGDTLFCGSAGRSYTPDDFPIQLDSIHRLVSGYPPETVIISGHGPFTTIAREKIHNPFIRVRESLS